MENRKQKLQRLEPGTKIKINKNIFIVSKYSINYKIGIYDANKEIHYINPDVEVEVLNDKE